MLASLDRHAAYVLGRRWDVLAWNPAAEALFGDYGRLHGDTRNTRNAKRVVRVRRKNGSRLPRATLDRVKRVLSIFAVFKRYRRDCRFLTPSLLSLRGGAQNSRYLHHRVRPCFQGFARCIIRCELFASCAVFERVGDGGEG